MMDSPYQKCSSYMTYDEEIAWESNDLTNTKFKDCTFANLKLDKIDVTNALFENCEFKNIHINELVGDKKAKFIKCRFLGCSINVINYLAGNLQGCSFEFSTEFKHIQKEV